MSAVLQDDQGGENTPSHMMTMSRIMHLIKCRDEYSK